MAHCMVDPDEAYEEARDNKAGFNDWPDDDPFDDDCGLLEEEE